MLLSTTSERGASGSPAPAGPPSGPSGRRLAVGLLAAAGVIAAAVVTIGTISSSSSKSSDSAVAADRDDIGGVSGVASTSAIAELERRTADDPEDLPAWQELSRRYLREAVATGDPAFYDLTRSALDRAGALAPGDPATTVTEGVLALSLHDFAQAREHGRSAHEQVPDDPDPLAILIDASVELGRYDEAEGHLSDLLALRPGSAALSRLSYLRELHGDLDGARLAMLQAEQATSASEDRATIATLIGDQLLASRDLTGAAAAYERARTAAPGLAATEIGRARVAAAQGRLDEAVATLTALVERSPAPAPAAVLGELQQAAGRDDEAADSFALARAGTELLSGAGSTVDLEAALFAADHGDPTEAVTFAEVAYRTRRTVFTADALGWALTKAGRPAEALPYVDEARRLGTRAPALHVHAAVALAATGDPAQAATALRTAFESSAWLVPASRPAGGCAGRPPGRTCPRGLAAMRRRTLLVAAGAAVVATALVAPARPAGAHPLGNLTVNTYAGIVVRDDEITVDYVLDLAELPTVQAMQRIDLDGDGELGPTEAARYRESECASLLDGLEVSLGGRPVPLTSGAGSVRLLPGQGGLETLRLECPLRGRRHARGRCRPRLHRRQLLRSHRLAGDHGGRRPHDRHRHRRARIVRVRPAARLSDRRSLPAAAGRGRREGRTGRAGPRSGGGVECAGRSAGAAGPGRGSSDLVVPAHGG